MGSASSSNERKINALYTWILRYPCRHESKALQSLPLSRNAGLLEAEGIFSCEIMTYSQSTLVKT